MKRAGILASAMTAIWLTCLGCGSAGPVCKTGVVLMVYPTTGGTADSAAKPPGNQVQFQAGAINTVVQQGSGFCPVSQLEQAEHPQWTSADTEHVTISSANDSTNGLATCTGPTAGAVTVTATLPAGSSALGAGLAAPLSATTQITCK